MVWKTYDPVKGIVAVVCGCWFGVGVGVIVDRCVLDVRDWSRAEQHKREGAKRCIPPVVRTRQQQAA